MGLLRSVPLVLATVVHVELAGSSRAGGLLGEATTILGSVRFGNRSLVRGSRYPDDHDLTLQNPNTHATRVAVQLPLRVVRRADTHVDLFETGVEYVDVSALPGLAEIAENSAAAVRLSDQDRQNVVSAFSLHWLSIRRGNLLVLHVAPAGLALRFVGPGGEGQFDPDLAALPTWQPLAHGDQNINGEPIRTLMGGFAPLVFHSWSPLHLLNIWLPTQQLVCQPLVAMDLTSLDVKISRHQYHIYAKDDLGERLNDCWAFSHDDAQQWLSLGDAWCVPALIAFVGSSTHSRFVVPNHDRNSSVAAIFHTTQTPHSSSPLPGEEITGPLWHLLSNLATIIRR
eukprot:COSAG02_NODE_4_length_69935_cov_46.806590_6_plen_341_part_00